MELFWSLSSIFTSLSRELLSSGQAEWSGVYPIYYESELIVFEAWYLNII